LALTDEEKLAYLAILAVFMILVVYFELRIMRGKAKSARKADLRKDEAYNAILTCRSVINVLERQGSSVYEARALVDRAKSHMQRGEHEIAIELCEKAREDLTRVRSPTPPADGSRRVRVQKDSVESVAEDIVSSRARPAEDSYQGARLEVQSGPNYLVAKFEMNTAREEVEAAKRSGRDISVASDMLKTAQAEFDSGNYSKALSLAVKAKKAASPRAAEETIPLRRVQTHEAPTEEVESEADDVVDICSSCGTEMDAEDTFCGSCGTRRMRERICPSCGRVASENDRFCRKCGSKVP
jgi:tetratricopeptide (TPR) repeat protein